MNVPGFTVRRQRKARVLFVNHIARLWTQCAEDSARTTRANARARNVGADSPCRVRMGYATETDERVRLWAHHGFDRGRLYSVRRTFHICKRAIAGRKRTHRTTLA